MRRNYSLILGIILLLAGCGVSRSEYARQQKLIERIIQMNVERDSHLLRLDQRLEAVYKKDLYGPAGGGWAGEDYTAPALLRRIETIEQRIDIMLSSGCSKSVAPEDLEDRLAHMDYQQFIDNFNMQGYVGGLERRLEAVEKMAQSCTNTITTNPPMVEPCIPVLMSNPPKCKEKP